MSRSYKKAIVQAHGCKKLKKYANGVIRRIEEVPRGKAYKKLFESWEIADIKYDWRFEQEPWCTKKCFKDNDNLWRLWK